jgi:hypothetical protein
MTGVGVAGVGVLTGWGEGAAALPAQAVRAAAGRRIVPLAPRAREADHLRRAPRECALAIDAVDTALAAAGETPAAIRGSETALVYVTAAGYAASNRTFLDPGARGSALGFPYTAPSAVPGEVAIAYGLSGPATVLIGGATGTLDALWLAARLVVRGACRRALVLAVETFETCGDLWGRARWLLPGPLVETATCAVLVPGAGRMRLEEGGDIGEGASLARRRAGETLSCEPLVGLALALERGDAPVDIVARWRDRRARLVWEQARASAVGIAGGMGETWTRAS